jgi:hypothetical protein
VGVEPGPALDDAVASLASLGLEPVARYDEPRFSAAALTERGGRTSLRVTSRRGTVLAMDADADDGALLSLDPRTGTDLTADGHADLVVVRTEPTRTCLALVEVDAVGTLRAVPADVPWLDARLCVSELADLDHDARVDALVTMPLRDLGEPAPSIAVPLTLDRRGVFVHGAWPPGFGESEIARRDALLEVATDRGDAPLVSQLAIEIAFIAALRGEGDDALRAALGRARALAIDAELARRLDHAEERARALREASRPAPSSPPSDATSESADTSGDRGPSRRPSPEFSGQLLYKNSSRAACP